METLEIAKKVKKRNGEIVPFQKEKIANAVLGAYKEVYGIKNPSNRIKEEANSIANFIYNLDYTMYDVEQIQNIVEICLMKNYAVAKAYILYRYKHEVIRQFNTTDKSILELLDGTNDYWQKENSNKDATNVTTIRDYLAGITSKDITERFLLPEDIVKAHQEGIIHFHDSDYFAQKINNCCLINIEDMLQNSTVISKVLIDKPHSFRTACTITTQIIAKVASSQYGGQSITLSHLAPFVDISRQAIRQEVLKEFDLILSSIPNYNDSINAFTYDELVDKITEERLRKEIADGVQTIQYQVITLMTTNGQAPFISIFMYLGEVKDKKTQKDLALIIEEVLRQRIKGVKNENGEYVTPAFPKLLFVLEESNIRKDGEYYYLRKLAVECSAKRLVPDYISEKKMLELKEGNCFPCMGCVEGNEIITYKYKDNLYVESFKRMWERLSKDFIVKHQYSIDNPNLYMDLENVDIYDTVNGFVETKRIIRNKSTNWVKVTMSNGRLLTCTDDHPFATNRGRVFAKDLTKGDKVTINHSQHTNTLHYNWDEDLSWAYGVMLCDGSIASTPNATFAIVGEDDILDKLKSTLDAKYDISCNIKEQHRGVKGNYKEISMPSRKLQYDLIKYFEGIAKNDRHIPNILFSMTYSARLSFLAGMIDADGYINSTSTLSKVQLGSTNKELALQQLALMQSLNMPAYMYENHYDTKHPEKVRYRVECIPSDDLINALQCKKKKDMFTNNIRSNSSIGNIEESEIISIEYLNMDDYSYDVTTSSDHFEVSGIYSHNCRSFLAPYKDENGNYKFYGRFNQGVVTINLVDVALSSKGDMEKFWSIFDERLELCHRALLCRHERLEGTLSDVAPILWQHGAFARLKKGEKIDKLLHNGYSSISLGYAGLYECVKYMTGYSHTDGGVGTDFGLKVMQKLKESCEKWNEEHNIGFSLYGTPIESTTEKFAKNLRRRFGTIEDITDHDYITNSYHVNVREKINAYDKLKIESKFQEYSTGGAVSYIETPNLQNNLDILMDLTEYIYNTIMYAEFNSKSDNCLKCNFEGEVDLIVEDDKVVWKCPKCGNTDQNYLHVARRTCGYIGENFWCDGRTKEIADRVLHIDDVPFLDM